MWKDKGLQLVMLPTETKVNALRGYADRSLLFRYQESYQILESESNLTCYYNLYLLSDEEIKERDKYYDSHNNLILTASESSDHNTYGYKKVITSTDPSLNLPQFPNAFIEEYVKRYNSKKSLEVEVEYEEYDHDEEWSEISGAYETFKERVKVNEHNTISIRFKAEKEPCTSEVGAEGMRLISKDVRTPKVTYPFDIKHNGEKMYSQAQMEMRLFEGIAHAISYPETFVTGICLDSTKTKNWIKENLK